MSDLFKILGTIGGFAVGGPQGAMAGASLGAGIDSANADNQARSDSLALAEKQRAETLKFIQDQMKQSRGDLFSLFPQAQQSRNAGMLAGLNLYGQAFPQQVNAFQTGNMNAQQTLLAGLPQMNNAVLGSPINMSGLQARRIPLDTSLLSGLYNPQPLNFPAITAPQSTPVQPAPVAQDSEIPYYG